MVKTSVGSKAPIDRGLAAATLSAAWYYLTPPSRRGGACREHATPR